MITFTLPYPPSVNKLWQNVRGRVVLTEAARRYKEEAYLIALTSHPAAKIPYFDDVDRLSISLRVYRPRAIGDLDNTAKIVLDSLQKVVYRNDSQIVEIHMYRYDDALNPRVEVEVSAVGHGIGVSQRKRRKLI
jgi:crossover junction endodeoxyribonuclease RusA